MIPFKASPKSLGVPKSGQGDATVGSGHGQDEMLVSPGHLWTGGFRGGSAGSALLLHTIPVAVGTLLHRHGKEMSPTLPRRARAGRAG